MPKFTRYLEEGQMEIIPDNEWYLKNGVFDRQRVLNAWIQKHNQALSKSYNGIRVASNMSWLEEKDWRNFTEYSKELNNVINNYYMLVLCSYPFARLGINISDVFLNHKIVLIKQAGNWAVIQNYESKWRQYGLDRSEHAKRAIQESENRYHALEGHMLNGFAYCKMLFDENNQPIDFIYLKINDAFERLTGIRKKDAINRRVTEVIPGIKESHPELFTIYGKVASTGEAANFDIYFKPLKIRLAISAYSTQKGYFIAVFENITRRKQAEERMKTVRAAPKKLVAIKERFQKYGIKEFSEHEMIELLLCHAAVSHEECDKKCKKLVNDVAKRYKTLMEFLAAPEQELKRIPGITPHALIFLRLVKELPEVILKKKIIGENICKSSQEVFNYLYSSVGGLEKEVFKIA